MTQTTLTYPVASGDVIKGKYGVERVLGEGGMGMVVAARHLELDERVAIKFLLPHALTNADAVGRFAREARSAAKIKSQHVVRTYDVDRLENGAPFIVMEYLEGVDLAVRLRDQGPLGVEDAVSLVLQTCEALADAHAVGIVHRDLKPANLLVTRSTDGSECVKVLDFGISKITNPGIGGPNMVTTNAAVLMGSPLYMSPEQMVSSRDADARSDLWSLGVTLFELLAGSPPFLADSIPELSIKIATAATPSLCERRPDVSAGLDAVLHRCLEKDPGRRYANVGELAVALIEFAPRRSRHSAKRALRVLQAAGLSASAVQLPPSTDPTPSGASANAAEVTMASWGQTRPPPRRRAGLAVGAALVVTAAAGVALLVRSRAPAETALSASASGALAEPSESAPPKSAASASSGLIVATSSSEASDPPQMGPPSASPTVESSPRPSDFVRSPGKAARDGVAAAGRPLGSAGAQKPGHAINASPKHSSGLPDYGGREY